MPSHAAPSRPTCTGSHDARLVVWDALTGTFLAHMEQHMRTITSVVWLESDSAKKKSGALGAMPENRLAAVSPPCLSDGVLFMVVWDFESEGDRGEGCAVGLPVLCAQLSVLTTWWLCSGSLLDGDAMGS
jgi:hypothetical protein